MEEFKKWIHSQFGTIRKFANALDLSTQHVYRIISSQNMPSIERIAKISTLSAGRFGLDFWIREEQLCKYNRSRKNSTSTTTDATADAKVIKIQKSRPISRKSTKQL